MVPAEHTLTLKFLGDVSIANLEMLTKILDGLYPLTVL